MTGSNKDPIRDIPESYFYDNMSALFCPDTWSDGAVSAGDSITYNPNEIVGLLVLATGNVVLEDASGHTLTLTSVAANTFLPLRPTKIVNGTTASVAVLYK